MAQSITLLESSDRELLVALRTRGYRVQETSVAEVGAIHPLGSKGPDAFLVDTRVLGTLPRELHSVKRQFPGAGFVVLARSLDPAAMLDAMRRDGELIAVRDPGSQEWLYPAWQFDGARPRHAIPRIVTVARESRVDEARLYEILTAPRGLVGDRRRLVDLLDEGREDEVVAVVRAG